MRSNPSPGPSPTIPILDLIPEGSGGNLGSPSSSDKSISGSEGGLTLQSVYDLYLSLCTQVTTQAAEIKSLKAQVKKLKKQARPFILHHEAWLRTVKRKNQNKKNLLKTSKRRSDDLDMDIDDIMDYTLANCRVLNSPRFMVKSWLVQDQTVLGKDYSNLLIADSLLKTIWFINAPCYGNEALASPKANEMIIPEQPATGKGKSNPFMAGSLPKTTKPT
ncbi:hypothetical protein Tco_0712233 [Tanacetum coccineum]